MYKNHGRWLARPIFFAGSPNYGLVVNSGPVDDPYYRRLVQTIFLVAGLLVLISLAYVNARYYGIFGFLTA